MNTPRTHPNEPLFVLLIEDDAADAFFVEELLADIYADRCTFRWVSGVEEGFALLEHERPDVCLVDYRIGPSDGLKTIGNLKARYPTLPCILLTGMQDPSIDAKASEAGAADYFLKQELNATSLERCLRYTLRNFRERQKTEEVMAAARCAWWRIRLPGGEVESLSESSVHLTGYSYEKNCFDPMFWWSILDKESIPKVQGLLTGLVQGYEVRDVVAIRHAEGAKRWLHFQAHPVSSDGQQYDYAEGIALDVTRQHEAEETRRQLHKAVMQTAEAIVITDANLDPPGPRVLFANPAFEKMTGYSVEEFIGRSPRALHGPDTDLDTRAEIRKALEAGESITREVVNYRKDGERYYCEVNITPIRDDSGRITRFVAIERDTTEEKKRAEELERALEKAEAANTAKSEFLAVMSHEMRTPLNPIMGFAGILLDSATDETERRYLHAILSSSERQLSLVNNILEYSRLERGTLQIQRRPFRPVQLCSEALRDMRANETTLEVNFREDPSLAPVAEDLQVNADAGMLRQVLDNLLSNACKYTEEGAITLTLGRENREGQDPLFCFSVIDTGTGIPERMRASLFSPFTQADTSFTRRFEGVGLGLAICKKLVDSMGGEIGVESREGEGSRFWFTVPLTIASSGSPTNNETASKGRTAKLKRSCHVLIVEDQRVNIFTARTFLKRLGATTDSALNGKLAVEKCSKERFDVILMDLAMPEMDGIEATRTIRLQGSLNEFTPVIALTANVSPEVREKSAKAGIDGYLTKPFKESDLLEVLEEALEEMATHNR